MISHFNISFRAQLTCVQTSDICLTMGKNGLRPQILFLSIVLYFCHDVVVLVLIAVLCCQFFSSVSRHPSNEALAGIGCQSPQSPPSNSPSLLPVRKPLWVRPVNLVFILLYPTSSIARPHHSHFYLSHRPLSSDYFLSYIPSFVNLVTNINFLLTIYCNNWFYCLFQCFSALQQRGSD